MGQQYGAICNNCGEKFTARDGGGMNFYLLHCDLCGKEKRVGLDEIRNLKLEGKKLSSKQKAEYIAGECYCEGDEKGQYKIDAPIRCPNCGSKDYKRDPSEPVAFYDWKI